MNLLLTDKTLHEIRTTDVYTCIDLSQMQISSCMGCFGCWIKTPGKCVIRDDAISVYPLIAQADSVIYVTRIVYGSYDIPMKTIHERTIPVQQAFIRIHHNETHHVQRTVLPKKTLIIAYGSTDSEEHDTFRALVARNSHNMQFTAYDIIFCSEEQIDTIVAEEIQKRWN